MNIPPQFPTEDLVMGALAMTVSRRDLLVSPADEVISA
jgi:hypothetical protein